MLEVSNGLLVLGGGRDNAVRPRLENDGHDQAAREDDVGRHEQALVGLDAYQAPVVVQGQNLMRVLGAAVHGGEEFDCVRKRGMKLELIRCQTAKTT